MLNELHDGHFAFDCQRDVSGSIDSSLSATFNLIQIGQTPGLSEMRSLLRNDLDSRGLVSILVLGVPDLSGSSGSQGPAQSPRPNVGFLFLAARRGIGD